MTFIYTLKWSISSQHHLSHQPMRQGVISNFKKYYIGRTLRQALQAVDQENKHFKQRLLYVTSSYNIYDCVNTINAAWREVSQSNMHDVWKYLAPQFYYDFKDFDPQEENKKVVANLREIARTCSSTWRKKTLRIFRVAHGRTYK